MVQRYDTDLAIDRETPGALRPRVLAGYGRDREGAHLVIDDVVAGTRERVAVTDAVFTLRALTGRYCTGRHDLETGRSQPCPDGARLEGPSEQCVRCWRATGFNPAFYNAPEISPQQERRNLEPHVVYLAHFGARTVKVGMTHERRGLGRLLEQGARVGAVLMRFEDAYRARELEDGIARQLGVLEAVRPARKRHLLGAPFSASSARQELGALIQRVRELRPDLDLHPELHELDERYGGPRLFERSLVDLSEAEPPQISGRCLGMVGDVLVCAQAGQHFLLSVGELVSREVELSASEQPNRLPGQLALPF